MPTPKKLNTEEAAEVKDDMTEAVVVPEPELPKIDRNAYAGPTSSAPPAPPGHVPAPFAYPKEDSQDKSVSAPYAGPGASLPDSRMYVEGNWAGKVNYECKLCPYSTLEKDNILYHIVTNHSGVESKVVKKTHS